MRIVSVACFAALAFAGAANAGQLTAPASARVIASEVVVPNGGLTGTLTASTELTNSVAVNSDATYSVTFALAGATFDGTPTISAEGTGVTATGTTYVQADGTALSIITVTGGANVQLDGFSLSGAIKVPAKANVTVASNTSVVTGGTTIQIDTVPATKVIEFKPLLAGFVTDAGSAEAQLPDYTTFSGGVATATLAEDILVKSNTGTFYGTVSGGTPITADTIIDGLTATVSGPAGAQLDVLGSTVGTTAPEDGATDTTAVYELAGADVTAILSGSGVDFAINNANEAMLNGVSYSIKLAPEYANGYSAAAEFGPYAAGEVTLEGTNFIAPWFTLNNANNTATLRLANQGTAATGPVFVTLKAANSGAVSGTRVQVSEGIAAGGVLEVSGPTLATLLGTSAQNGDLQVTVQGDGSVISGKVSIRNVSGATFETSLGNLGSNNSTP
jgi:hypothetical protein